VTFEDAELKKTLFNENKSDSNGAGLVTIEPDEEKKSS
jgi:hypothetical protein